MVDAQERVAELRGFFDRHVEWLLVPSEGDAFPINNKEIEVKRKNNDVLLGFLDNKGFHSWRINEIGYADDEIRLDLAGAFRKNRTRIRLVPRIAAAALAAEIELARLKRANTIAELIKDGLNAKSIRRVSLSKDNGRLAHIFFEDDKRVLNAAIADVSACVTPESLLASAIIWHDKLSVRKKDKVKKVWIIAEKRWARNIRKLHALLTNARRDPIHIAEISIQGGVESLVPLKSWRTSDLWRERSKKLALPEDPQSGEAARDIIAITPDQIDVIYSRQGETLRFMGLPFARMRSVVGKERGWFGTEKNRELITNESRPRLRSLVDELSEYRRHDSANKRHRLYRQAPEAWLESILRRNIALLDPNIILSPIYNQFRASNDRIDLLALRKDGRLVIIELKASPDREMIFQAADYWRKIEVGRRQGRLHEARLFGDREIIDKPSLVYLVAPAWSFHRDFEYFARMLTKEIELWRFELHEDWRREVKVIARRSYADFSGSTNL
jgi:hypothetical protein